VFLLNQPDIVASRRNGIHMFVGTTLGLMTGVVAIAAFGDKPWFLLPVQFTVFFTSLLWYRCSTVPLAALMFGVLFAFGVPEFVAVDPIRPILWAWFMATLGIVLGVGVQMIPRPDDPEGVMLDDLAGRLHLAADGLDRLLRGEGPVDGLTTLAALEAQVRLLGNTEAKALFEQRREDERVRLTIAVQRLVAGVRWLAPEIQTADSGGSVPPAVARRMESVRDFCRSAARALVERRPLDPEPGAAPPSAPAGSNSLAATLAQLEEATATARASLGFLGSPRQAEPKGPPPTLKAPLWVSSSPLSDPEAVRFALKGATAAILGSLLYEATGWAERSTNQFLILVASAQARAIGASVRDTILRLAGTVVGLAAAFAVISAGFPAMRGIAMLLAVSAPVFFVGAWIQRSPRFATAGIYLAINYGIVAFARTNDLPDPAAALARARALILAIAIVFAVGALLWPSYATSERGSALARAVRPLAAAFRALPDGMSGLVALRAGIAGTRQRLLDFLGILELAELEPSGGRSSGGRPERAWLAAATPVQSLMLAATTRSIRQQESEASPPADVQAAERRACAGFAATLDAIAADLESGRVAAVAPPPPLDALRREPAVFEPYSQMADSLARLGLAAAAAVTAAEASPTQPAPAPRPQT
jgi:uncharacterized membrane protein YccC